MPRKPVIIKNYSFFIYISLLQVWFILYVDGFHVTKRSHYGDDAFGRMDDVSYTTYISTEKQQEFVVGNRISNSITLVPLSTNPLLMVSSGRPLLNPDECSLLCTYFSKKLVSSNSYGITMLDGQRVLKKLQKMLDELVLRREDTPVEPRYLFYDRPEDSSITHIRNFSDKTDLYPFNNLFPDGLHVDTNNGKFFRYLTVLVYLTSSDAATAFPLANLDKSNDPHAYQVIKAAKNLILADVQHTRQIPNPEKSSDPNGDAYDSTSDHQAMKIRQHQSLIENSFKTGVRVVPKQGHIAAFISVDPSSGRPDAYSFHGSEVSTDEKQVLTFFYEIPVHQFSSQAEFGYQVGLRVDALKQRYCFL